MVNEKLYGISQFKILIVITTIIFSFTNGIFRRYLHYHSIDKKIINEITDEKSPSVISLVIKIYYYRWIY